MVEPVILVAEIGVDAVVVVVAAVMVLDIPYMPLKTRRTVSKRLKSSICFQEN